MPTKCVASFCRAGRVLCVDIDRLVRAAQKIWVNGTDIATHWDLDRSVRDAQGREALGVTEADPALPGHC